MGCTFLLGVAHSFAPAPSTERMKFVGLLPPLLVATDLISQYSSSPSQPALQKACMTQIYLHLHFLCAHLRDRLRCPARFAYNHAGSSLGSSLWPGGGRTAVGHTTITIATNRVRPFVTRNTFFIIGEKNDY